MLSERKVVLGLDLDGVLYDWHGALYTHFQYEMGYEGSYNEFWNEFITSWSKDKADYWVSIPHIYSMRSPSEPVLKFLEYVRENAYDVWYITGRPWSVEVVTRKFLKTFDFPFYENLVMMADKPMTARLKGVTHFIDDFAEHTGPVASVCDSYLLEKLWNVGKRDGLNTVASLEEFRVAVFGE